MLNKTYLINTKIDSNSFYLPLTYVSLLVILTFFGCSGANTVRDSYGSNSGKKIIKSEKTKNESNSSRPKDDNEEQKSDEFAKLKEIAENEAKIAQRPQDKQNKETSKSSIKLPTLREQMISLSDRQDEFTKHIDTQNTQIIEIKNDVTAVKSDIKEIKGNIEVIKTAIQYLADNRNKKGEAGAETLAKDNADNQPKLENANFIVKKQIDPTPNPNRMKISADKKEVKEPKEKKEKTKPKTELSQSKPNKKDRMKIKPDDNDKKSKQTKQKEESLKNEEQEVSLQPQVEEKKVKIETEDYKMAMNSISKKDYAGAIDRLLNIAKREKDPAKKSECHYWLGESHFGLKQYEKAIDYFTRVIRSVRTSKSDDATVMLAESQIRSGKTTDAKGSLQSLLSKYPDSEYIPRARKMLQQL